MLRLLQNFCTFFQKKTSVVEEIFTCLEEEIEDMASPPSGVITPLAKQYPKCIGCRNWHGRAYNGTAFICAIHPHGVEEVEGVCPDR